jgi:hypothetical protein
LTKSIKNSNAPTIKILLYTFFEKKKVNEGQGEKFTDHRKLKLGHLKKKTLNPFKKLHP